MPSSLFYATGRKGSTTQTPHLDTLPADRVPYLEPDISIGFNWLWVKYLRWCNQGYTGGRSLKLRVFNSTKSLVLNRVWYLWRKDDESHDDYTKLDIEPLKISLFFLLYKVIDGEITYFQPPNLQKMRIFSTLEYKICRVFFVNNRWRVTRKTILNRSLNHLKFQYLPPVHKDYDGEKTNFQLGKTQKKTIHQYVTIWNFEVSCEKKMTCHTKNHTKRDFEP
jgi:hypothetical protein